MWVCDAPEASSSGLAVGSGDVSRGGVGCRHVALGGALSADPSPESAPRLRGVSVLSEDKGG